MSMSGSKRKHDGEINEPRLAMDLFVPLPKKTASLSATDPVSLPQAVLLDGILARLAETGYDTVALTHTIYGRPRDPDDRVAIALPTFTVYRHPRRPQGRLTIRRRLHVVVENVADLQIFAPQSSHQALLQEYDLISVSPRNEQAFQMVCTCDGVDIVTLEGSTSHNRLPFKLRATDVRAVVQRGAVLEIPYASSILHRTARQGLVQTARALVTSGASTTATARGDVVCSSGPRHFENTDVGPMALRTPGDLANLWRVVLGFDPVMASRSTSRSGQVALDHAWKRRYGACQSMRVVDASIVDANTVDTRTEEHEPNHRNDPIQSIPLDPSKPEPLDTPNDDSDRGEDGFISF